MDDFPSKFNPAGRFRDSKLIRLGAIILFSGFAPLVFVVIAARLGLTNEPNLHPAFFDLLAGLSFWPGIILFSAGWLTANPIKRK